LLGSDHDLHIDAVLCKLVDHGQTAIRLDPDRVSRDNTVISASATPAGLDCTIGSYGGTFKTGEITGVLCRYAIDALLPAAKDPIEKFSDAEFLAAFLGALRIIPSTAWINDPYIEAKADNKLLQLATARETGLLIPRSLVTNNRSSAISFADSIGECVVKPISDTPLIRSRDTYVSTNVIEEGYPTEGFYASRLDKETLLADDSDISCSVFLQELIGLGSDIRATVVDRSVFSARVVRTSRGGRPIDFRNDPDIRTEPFDLAPDVSQRICSMVQRLGLRFASCDLIQRDGAIFFLEANVSGNWLWTENEARLPVSDCLASALIHGWVASTQRI
jgi:hypothetical protein